MPMSWADDEGNFRFNPYEAIHYPKSELREDEVEQIRSAYQRSEELEVSVCSDARICSTPSEGCLFVHKYAFAHGFRILISPFWSEFLEFYGIAPSQYALNT